MAERSVADAAAPESEGFVSGSSMEVSKRQAEGGRGSQGRKSGRVRMSKLLSYVGVRGRRRKVEVGKGSPGFGRVVYCSDPERQQQEGGGGPGGHKYDRNAISTTKYSALTFFPKGLYEQFRRVANLYFLMCAVLALTPLSPYTPASLIAPLVLVVGVSMTKEAVEDYRRRIADREVNSRLVEVHCGGGVFEERQWQQVRVGDVVRVVKDSFFPADLLFLSSSYPDGVCYVETMNLDGETNLKLRKALERTCELDSEEKVGTELKGAVVRCEDPNPSLYTFVGNLEWQGSTTALDAQQLLLRDSKLRNTPWVFGCVVFTGHDTKVMQNSTEIPSKRSSIEQRMDKIVYLLFATLLLLSISGSIVFGITLHNSVPSWFYLYPQDADVYYNPNQAGTAAVLQALTALILYGYLIPISLYVSIEIVKIFQAWFISADLGMYHAESDKPARARTSNLNEELGQVDTILSDKTGTLTCNQMEFLKCSIGGTAYGRGITEVERATAKRLGLALTEMEDYDPEEDAEEQQAKRDNAGAGDGDGDGDDVTESKRSSKVKGFALKDKRLSRGCWMLEPNAESIRMFLRELALCHTVIPEEDASSGIVKYEAESPDEAALVETARQLGFEFVRRTQSSVVLREPDPGASVGSAEEAHSVPCVEREYEILNVIEFNSTRKRMTVIVRTPEGTILLFCKGADSVIFPRLSAEGRVYEEATRAHVQRYGEAGLRTLALAYARLDEEKYEQWRRQFETAKTSLESSREALLDAAAEQIETGLTLLGATAVEDKLQRGVPQAIDHLAQAGIKIWVLTGDKMETAINIGFACSLLRDDMRQIVVSLDTPEIRKIEDSGDMQKLAEVCQESVGRQLAQGAAQVEQFAPGIPRGNRVGGLIGRGGQEDDEEEEDEGGAGGGAVFALIIDGKSLTYALDGPLKPQLLALAMQCASVICCRVSPKQKALITRLVKDGTGKTTLGIGDGANDVGMIHEAHIGVGISGVEGQQAVMASDFAIAQFCYLERLLLMHGHWCYKRIACMVTYFFFKNVAYGLTLFYYNAYSTFSGQVLYNSWAAASYNVFFTSLPVVAYGVLEQDVSAKSCFEFPALYQDGPSNVHFRWSTILRSLLNGVYVSVALFWFTFAAINPQATAADGTVMEVDGIGATLMSGVVMAVTLQMALLTEHFTWISHLFIWGSIVLWLLFLLIISYLPASFSTNWYHVLPEVIGPNALFWLVGFLLLPAVGVLPFFLYKAVRSQFAPPDCQIVNELVRLHKDEEAAKEAVAPLKAPVGFSAAVEAVSKKIRKAERKRGRRRSQRA